MRNEGRVSDGSESKGRNRRKTTDRATRGKEGGKAGEKGRRVGGKDASRGSRGVSYRNGKRENNRKEGRDPEGREDTYCKGGS